MKKNKILCIIPARGGSKGVKRKNIRLLNGKPLISYTIEAALNSDVIDRLVVSTEDAEIAEVAKKYGAEVIDRPEDLANDTALTEPVMEHVLKVVEEQGYVPDYISLIQCTSPFLTSDVIKKAVSKIEENEFDSCITTFYPETFEFKWKKADNGQFIPDHDVDNRPRKQDMNLPYHENGAFYVTKTDLFKKSKNRYGGNIARVTSVHMKEIDSLQIDTEDQLWLAEQIMKKQSI